MVSVIFWCERRDLNPYAEAHAPQTCLSANSSTLASCFSCVAFSFIIIAEKQALVNT